VCRGRDPEVLSGLPFSPRLQECGCQRSLPFKKAAARYNDILKGDEYQDLAIAVTHIYHVPGSARVFCPELRGNHDLPLSDTLVRMVLYSFYEQLYSNTVSVP
jgi:hypothetical protein